MIDIVEQLDTERKLPEGWKWVRLGDIADVVNGYGFREDLQGHTHLEFPFIKVSDMNAATIEIVVAKNTVDRTILTSLGAKTYPKGTIIFPKVGGALLTNKKRVLGVEASFDNNIMGVIPKNINPQWLYLWIQALDLASLANTQALPSIRQSVVANLQLPYPPLNEQQRISYILTNQLAETQQARAAAEVQLKAAQELPIAYLREIFEGDEVAFAPKVRLGDVLILRKDVVHPRDNPQGTGRFVGLEHIERGTGQRLGELSLELTNLTGRKPRFYAGDIVYGYLRPYLNKVWVAEFDGLCSVDQYVYSVNQQRADTHFIAWFMRSRTYLDRAPIDTTPGQLPRIRIEEVASVEVNLPSLDQQQQIAQEIEEYMIVCRATTLRILESIESINSLPAALLRQAFSGAL
jgi:restriction endonuclease S subunit